MKLKLIYTSTLVLLGDTNAKARSLQTCEDLADLIEQCEMNTGGKTDLGASQCYLGLTTTSSLGFGMQATVSFLCIVCLFVSISKLIGFGI